MKRLALVLGISLIAACGDDGGNNTNTCGDGVKAGSEQCDDGNTTSGDGCSSSCQIEVAPACGDNHVDTGEECDDGNTTDGDGCSSTCQNEAPGPRCGDHHTDPGEDCDDGNTTNGDGCSSTCHDEPPPVVCGNGMVETGETCDDGNTTAGDGCSATCAVEMNYTCTGMPSVCTMMPANGTCALPFTMPLTATGAVYSGTGTGDTSTGTNQVDIHDCDSETGTGGAGAAKDQVWKFVNPVAQKVVISLNNHIATPSFDGVLRVMTTACDVTTQVPDSATHADGCSDTSTASSNEVITFNNLAAGTYYVLVDGFDAAATGMYSLTITGGVAVCGNNAVEPGEGCDDHNTTAGDGCSATCTVETGYTCTGSPSVCTSNCGNGTLNAGESCDDTNTTAGDGCSATCLVESGYSCTGSPSVCTLGGGTCAAPKTVTLSMTGGIYTGTGAGDTTGTTSEVAGASCDNQATSGLGHDQTWMFVNPVTQPVLITLAMTPATTFDGAIRLMSTACSLPTQIPDDVIAGDGAATSDGCADLHTSSATERLNYNWLPAGTYYLTVDGFVATSNGTYSFTIRGGGGTCGNGVLEQNERCDDGNTTANDGCSATCTIEPTFTCTGAPSVCTTTCGNGVVGSGETCDDGARVAGDGCNQFCQVEAGYVCTGAPSVCHTTVCGNGMKEGSEACDDGNTAAGDGCSATCTVEAGYSCTGSAPSVCGPLCGNGDIDGAEECDAGGTTSLYCDATCHLLFDTTDTEVNNTGAAAQVLTPTHHIIKGSLPANDVDIFTFTLTAPAVVTIETYSTYEQNYDSGTDSDILHLSCPSIDTEIGFWSTLASVSVTDPTSDNAHDDDDGDGSCSYLSPNAGAMLPAGQYWFTVHDYNGQTTASALDPIAQYFVDFNVTP